VAGEPGSGRAAVIFQKTKNNGGTQMSSKKTGFLIYFDENRRAELLKNDDGGGLKPFTDALSILDWDFGKVGIAMFGFSEGTLDYISLATKGNIVVTAKQRVEFSAMVSLNSLSVKELEVRLNTNVRRYFIKSTKGVGGTFPKGTWDALVEAIKISRPNLVAEIDRLLSLQKYSGVRLVGEAADVLTQEREAIGISLDIFTGSGELRKRVLSEWAPDDESVILDENHQTGSISATQGKTSSFMSGLSTRFFQEESAIQHDLFNWAGMSPTHQAGVSIFEQGNRRLEIVYANRNALEHTLGVDLIYYKQAYGLFSLIQYKLMREEGQEMVYRPDSNISEELVRMNGFYLAHRNEKEIQNHEDFRINDDGFFIKLIPNKGIQAASGELSKGMYFTRKYMEFLLGSRGPKGDHGGRRITFKSAPRYLTNTQFADNVHSGWIGSSGVQSQEIKKIICSYYESGRALLLSVERTV
jgi:hypothetical protein